MGKKTYLRKEEKDEVMAISSLMQVMKEKISKIEKFKPDDKKGLLNAKRSLAYTTKFLQGIFETLDNNVLEEIKIFVKTKRMIIMNESEYRNVITRNEKDNKIIEINIEDYDAMIRVITGTICVSCDGFTDCVFKKVMLQDANINGAKEYDICPFSNFKVLEAKEDGGITL